MWILVLRSRTQNYKLRLRLLSIHQRLKNFFKIVTILILLGSVPDPWHFGVDSDPDPRIHASDEWIRILDLDPAIFVIDLQDAIKKTNF
jgi:hypothetical protein